MSDKTLGMLVLEGQGIPYQVIEFPEDVHDAVGVADYAGLSPDMVYKTLVAQADDPGFKPLLVMIPAAAHLDLKKLAKAVGAKKVRMARHADAEALTGLKTGGISALALLNKGFAIYIDQWATVLDEIAVSAGQRGLNVKLNAADLIAVTGAEVIDTIGEEW